MKFDRAYGSFILHMALIENIDDRIPSMSEFNVTPRQKFRNVTLFMPCHIGSTSFETTSGDLDTVNLWPLLHSPTPSRHLNIAPLSLVLCVKMYTRQKQKPIC